jgi:hypothetical protein
MTVLAKAALLDVAEPVLAAPVEPPEGGDVEPEVPEEYGAEIRVTRLPAR